MKLRVKGSSLAPLVAAAGPGRGMVVAGRAARCEVECELLFAAPLAAAAGPGRGIVVAGGAAGCELLFATAPLVAAAWPGWGMVVAGGAAGWKLLFAAPLVAAAGPGPAWRCVSVYRCDLRRCGDSTTPFYLAVSCRLAWGGLGRRDQRCDYDHLL